MYLRDKKTSDAGVSKGMLNVVRSEAESCVGGPKLAEDPAYSDLPGGMQIRLRDLVKSRKNTNKVADS